MAKPDSTNCLECGKELIQFGKGRLRKRCPDCQEKNKRKPEHYLVCLCGNRRLKGKSECRSCELTKWCSGCKRYRKFKNLTAATCSKECGMVAAAMANRTKRHVKMCCFCGSALIVADCICDKQEKFYCDIECAGAAKRWDYMGEEYQNQEHIIERRISKMMRRHRKEYYNLVLQRGWKCCIWCDVAYARKGRTCSDRCSYELTKAHARANYHHNATVIYSKCRYCGQGFAYKMLHGYKARLYCSTRCARKAQKQLRRSACRNTREIIGIQKLMRKHRSRCVQCGCKCILPTGSNLPHEATHDHIMPLSKGGLHTWSNAQLLCRACNTSKGTRIIENTQLMLGLW